MCVLFLTPTAAPLLSRWSSPGVRCLCACPCDLSCETTRYQDCRIENNVACKLEVVVIGGSCG